MKNAKAARRLRDQQRLKELERELLPQPRMKELMQACKRVGIKPEKEFAWVLNFCTKDLNQLSSGDWTNLIFEVAWFAIYGPGLSQGWDVASRDDLQEFILNPARPLPTQDMIQDLLQESILNPNCPLPTQDMIRDLQQWAKARLEEFIANGETVIALQPKSVLVVKRDRKTARAEMMLLAKDLHQGFAFSFAQTLRLAGAKLNQCPECQKYYSARANQTYCSPRCQNNVSLRNFRKKTEPASQPSKKKVSQKKNPNGRSQHGKKKRS
jgi:endogenous inhibitor of DNA gyrase (YacG/DUF329 family)